MPTWELTAGDTASGGVYSSADAFNSVAGRMAIADPEGRAQAKVYSSYTWTNLYVRCTTFNPPNNNTVRSRKNGAFGNLTVTVSGTGAFQDTVNSDALVDQDLICLQYTGIAAGDRNFSLWGSTLQDTGTNITLQVASGGATIAEGLTRYGPIAGRLNAATGMATTESDVQYTVRRATAYSNLRVFVGTNTIDNNSPFTFRKNIADGSQVATITPLATGAFEDTTNSDSVVAGDEIDYSLVTGADPGFVAVHLAQLKHTSTGREAATANPIGTSRTGDAFFGAEADASSTSTEVNSQIAARAAFTASNLFVNVTAHGASSGVDFFLRQNTANSALTVNVPQNTTGLFEDTTNSVSIALTDLYNYFQDHGGGVGAITVTVIGMAQGPTDAISGGGKGYPTQMFNSNRRHRSRAVGRGLRVP